MMSRRLRGVIAAITTPVSESLHPDASRFQERAEHLLENGCDGLNVLGTTGEATSFSTETREQLMCEISRVGLPTDRMLVGTGAAAVADAIRLTRVAAQNGFCGALVLPPFYYKPVRDDGVVRFFDALVRATADEDLPLYLYNFPALTGVPYTERLVETLLARFGERIAGLKDSSGDLDYARRIAALSHDLDVFPSSEETLPWARDNGPFAGCISATANLNSVDCGSALAGDDDAAVERAVAFRRIFDGLPLVPGVKAMVAHLTSDPMHGLTMPPLAPLTEAETSELLTRYASLGRTAAK